MNNENLDSQLIKPHYSTKLVRSFYNYLKKYYSEKLFDDIIEEIGLPKSYLLNDDNWISNNYSKTLCDKIIEKTQNKNIFFEIGTELLSSENINPFELELIKLMPPYVLFKMMPMQSQKLNNIFKLSIIKASPGHFIYRVDSIDKEEQAHEAVFQNTEGCFYAFKTMLNLNYFELKNKILTNSNGENYKIIELKYRAFTFWIKKVSPIIISTSILFYVISNISSFEKSTVINVAIFTILGLFTLLFFSLSILNSFTKLVKGNKLYYKNTKEKNEHIYQKTKELEHKLKEEQYIKNICLTLIKANKPEDIIDDSLNSICLNSRYQKAMVMLASEKNKNLKTVSLRGISDNSRLKSLTLSYPAVDPESYLFANILDNKKAVLIDDLVTFKEKIKKENRLLMESLNVSSLIVSPIGDADRSYGLLVIGNTDRSNLLNKNDLMFIEHISSLMSLFFQKSYTLETESTLRSVFEKYVPKNVLLEMNNLKDKNSWRIPPQSKNVASMFIDLRGFTNVSESMAPEKVFKMLDSYFEEIAIIVGAHGGIIDNIIADEMVIFFPQTNAYKHCSDALTTAIEICAEWSKIQEKVAKADLPTLSIGIGLHSGPASIGTVGSDIRSNYTCLGDTINSTSRIQKLTRKYFKETDSVAILASETLFNEAQIPVKYKRIENEKMRGKKQEINLMLIEQADAINFNSLIKKIKAA